MRGASNQVLPTAQALVSCRIVADQSPHEVFEKLRAFLVADPPWGVRVEVTKLGDGVMRVHASELASRTKLRRVVSAAS